MFGTETVTEGLNVLDVPADVRPANSSSEQFYVTAAVTSAL